MGIVLGIREGTNVGAVKTSAGTAEGAETSADSRSAVKNNPLASTNTTPAANTIFLLVTVEAFFTKAV